MKHLWLRRFQTFQDLETNPATQYRVHTLAQRFWIANIPFYVGWFVVSPRTFIAFGVLLTGVYSLYSNWSTDNGAAAAARGVMNTTPPTSVLQQEIRSQPHEPVG